MGCDSSPERSQAELKWEISVKNNNRQCAELPLTMSRQSQSCNLPKSVTMDEQRIEHKKPISEPTSDNFGANELSPTMEMRWKN